MPKWSYWICILICICRQICGRDCLSFKENNQTEFTLFLLWCDNLYFSLKCQKKILFVYQCSRLFVFLFTYTFIYIYVFCICVLQLFHLNSSSPTHFCTLHFCTSISIIYNWRAHLLRKCLNSVENVARRRFPPPLKIKDLSFFPPPLNSKS